MTSIKTGSFADAGLAIIIGLIMGLIAAQLVNPTPQPANAAQTAAFDHSNCQYPDRWTNPVDGCDNSDPAVPECIKAASSKESEDACIAYYSAHNPYQPPVVEQPKPAQTTEAAQCGGK